MVPADGATITGSTAKPAWIEHPSTCCWLMELLGGVRREASASLHLGRPARPLPLALAACDRPHSGSLLLVVVGAHRLDGC